MLSTDATALSRLLEARPLGATLWIRGTGTSMRPLIRSGDALRVLRCDAAQISRGDIAVLAAPTGGLIAHVVVRRRPLATSSFLGQLDSDEAPLLGRVVALRRGRLTIPLGRVSRPALYAAHRAAAGIYGQPALRVLARSARELLFSSATRPVRSALLGEVEVRRLLPADLERALLYLGDNAPGACSRVAHSLPREWLSRGAAFGAIQTSSLRMVGFVFFDEYRREGVDLDGYWIRYLHVAPLARGMGLARFLLRQSIVEARQQGITELRADVLASNAPSLALFESEGFQRSAALTVLVDRALGHAERHLIAFVRSTAP